MLAPLLPLSCVLFSNAGVEASPAPPDRSATSASAGAATESAPTLRAASSPLEAPPGIAEAPDDATAIDDAPAVGATPAVVSATPAIASATPAAASEGHGALWDPPKRPLSRRQLAGKAPISIRLKTLGELGSLNVLAHSLQFGKSGTEFDLRRDGRQDTMFLFRRLSAELEVDDHHQIILLYQPIRFDTTTVLMQDLVADDVTFPAMSGLSILYGFDIYRLSYAYDFFTDPEQELAVGFSMQVRNFRHSYVSSDGERSVANTNIGAVPIIKLRGRHQLRRANFWYGGEIDGFYANIPYVNGGDDPVEGLIVDASLRAGVTVAKVVRPFANLRYIGGGGKGTSSDKVGFGDGYSSNWLHTIAFSLGAEVIIPAVVGDRRARDREIAARKAKRKAR
ncbi:MAG: hypothetical protein IPK80_19360 [Nannocystis sp.]|nr:hypothetical protein [Nannocystis sp.]